MKYFKVEVLMGLRDHPSSKKLDENEISFGRKRDI